MTHQQQLSTFQYIVCAVLNPEPAFTYPPAEASHDDVVNNAELFNALLKKVMHCFVCSGISLSSSSLVT